MCVVVVRCAAAVGLRLTCRFQLTDVFIFYQGGAVFVLNNVCFFSNDVQKVWFMLRSFFLLRHTGISGGGL